MKNLSSLCCAIGILAAGGRGAAAMVGAEDFAGPFPSWRNLKTAYGAVGDGRTDDTAALQRALDDLAAHQDFCVLYVPAGHYRLTSTLHTLRKQDRDCKGVAIIGESPENTVLQWDGPADGTLFHFDAWYSKLSRLTLDGAGRARLALCYGPTFSTYNETSDMVFQNTGIGLQFGDEQQVGQAENEVLRCRFYHCTDAGVRTSNFNCLDIWVWYCCFKDCRYALLNDAGNFHAWQNVFLRSTAADVQSKSLQVFSFVNNTSLDSQRFLDFDIGYRWGSPMTISGNRILNPIADFPLKLGNGGPYLVMDNVFKLPAGSTNRAAKMTWGDQTFVGNTYTTTNAVLEAGRFRRVAEQVRDGREIEATLPALPPTPENQHRKIIEVGRHFAESAAAVIQQALEEADKFRGQRPMVHLPMGVYNISKTLVIAAESDVQLVGDSAGDTGTRLNWTGPPGGVLLKLKGPSLATLRDLYLNAPRSRALLVEHADQAGGKIFADQLNAQAPTGPTDLPAVAVAVNGLARTDVLFRCLQGGGNSGTWVEVTGPSAPGMASATVSAAPPAKNQISIFTGATGSAVGQYAVRNGGELTARSIYHEISSDTLCGIFLTNSGVLALDACRFCYHTSPRWPMVALQDFHGFFTMATCMLNPRVSTNTIRFELSGAGGETHALALNDLFWVLEPGVASTNVWINRTHPRADAGLIGCNMNSERKGLVKTDFGFLDDVWTDSGAHPPGGEAAPAAGAIPDAVLLRHLAPLRAARVWLPDQGPAHATDLRIYRVQAVGGPEPVVEFRAAE